MAGDVRAASPPLRVVQVLEAMGGGTKKNVSLLADGLRRRGVEVVLALALERPLDPDYPMNDYTFPDAMRARGFRVEQFDFVHGHITPLNDLRALVALVRFFRRERFAAVHTHSAKAGALGRAAAWLAGVPVIVHTPYSLPFRRETDQGAKYWFYYGIEWLLSRTTNTIIASGASECQEIQESGIAKRTTVTTILNCFDLESHPWPPNRRDARIALGLDPDRPLVGTAARLALQKGLPTLVEASASILRAIPDAQFVVVGEGDQRAALEAQALRSGVHPAWLFTGARADARTFIQAFDVFAFPSLWEGLPFAPIEAMALGTPVVATAAVGTTDLVRHDVNGLLVPIGDAQALADAVVRVLADSALAGRLAAAGRTFVEELFGGEEQIDATLRSVRPQRCWTARLMRRHEIRFEGGCA